MPIYAIRLTYPYGLEHTPNNRDRRTLLLIPTIRYPHICRVSCPKESLLAPSIQRPITFKNKTT
ncbi:Hypothetical protein CpMEX30_1887 [Corynebacterium pseudotuberculosis]|uniref:Uncharacterized protein n=1 Tax=Corynebacterium pseudotuberculosis 258 TaxID=1168865 RepID=A0AAX1FLE3_CORPS|nr:hypothetical protein CPCIP5297_09330 [Corynebacterium pseudotuberculosis CIP 52.97]AER69809.1 Hypothetical protein Cp106_1758 [Corynebacterium pseudotuberculosis 1/06-A]AFB73148.1 hypothetical protein CP316_09320 [Corynebacterium pseudotuberculosis 316]APQ54880.1 Hypothetical protein CpMEX30_1887 [Corynebacterium pseudotuberculosis]QGW56970.1 hypothetical protein CP258_09330 [Corynebacterium pseudotuberculosis 258]